MRDDDVDPETTRARTNGRLLQAVSFAAIYLIWGSTYLAIRVGVGSLPPFSMAACRFLTAGMILYAILRARGVAAPDAGEWLRAGVAGLLMLTGGNGLVTWAELRIASNLAALLVSAVPIYVAVFDWLRPGGTAAAPRVWIGVGVGALGMLLLVMHGGSAAAPSSPAAVAALLVSGLCWSIGSLYSRYGSMHRHPLMAAAQQMLAGGVGQLIVAAARGEHVASARVSAASAAALAYLTVFGSLVAFSAYGWLIKVSTPARVSTTAYVNPMVAVVLGWALLGERLAARALSGAALIVCAVMIMTVRLPARLTRARARPDSLAAAGEAAAEAQSGGEA